MSDLQLFLGEPWLAWALTASRGDNSQPQQYSHLFFVGFSMTGAFSCHCSLSFLSLSCPVLFPTDEGGDPTYQAQHDHPVRAGFCCRHSRELRDCLSAGLSNLDKGKNRIPVGSGRPDLLLNMTEVYVFPQLEQQSGHIFKKFLCSAGDQIQDLVTGLHLKAKGKIYLDQIQKESDLVGFETTKYIWLSNPLIK